MRKKPTSNHKKRYNLVVLALSSNLLNPREEQSE